MHADVERIGRVVAHRPTADQLSQAHDAVLQATKRLRNVQETLERTSINDDVMLYIAYLYVVYNII